MVVWRGAERLQGFCSSGDTENLGAQDLRFWVSGILGGRVWARSKGECGRGRRESGERGRSGGGERGEIERVVEEGWGGRVGRG